MYVIAIGSVAAGFYLLAGGLLGMRLSRAGSSSTQGRGAKTALVGLGAAAAALHALVLLPQLARPEGANLSFFNALSFTGWLVALLFVLFAVAKPVENLGIVLLPFSAVTVILAAYFPAPNAVMISGGWPLRLHILSSVAAYAVLAMAAVQASLLAVQDYRLRRRHPGGFVRGLPPLSTMEALLFQLIIMGFVLLSVALLSGFLFLNDVFAQHLMHKTTLSVMAWLLFGTLIWGRQRFGWRGRTAVRWTLAGFVVLVLAYFGSQLVLQLILQRR